MNLKSLTTGDLMTPRVLTASRNESLRSAARRMVENRVRSLLVPAEGPNRAPGIITEKDIVQLLGDTAPDVLDELTVADAMTCPAITVPRYLCVADTINLMRMTGVRRAFVLEGNAPVGVICFTDVLRFVATAHAQPEANRAGKPEKRATKKVAKR